MRRLVVAFVCSLLLVSTVPAGAASATGAAQDRATILRDEYGVPHIYAQSAAALFYGMGYVAATDRLWQAEILRRSATGTLAQLFGSSVYAQDVQARTLFPRDRRIREYEQASPRLRTTISSYVAGINARIDEETAAGTLPPQFGLFGPPRPWTTDDVVAVFMLLGSQFGWFGSDEPTNTETLAKVQAAFGPDAPKVLADLFWLDDPDAPTTVPPSGAVGHKGRAVGAPVAALSPHTLSAAGQYETRSQAAQAARQSVGITLEGHSSNAMVISSRLSEDGAPLLLGGPQMGYSTPQINHEVGLHGAGFDVTGMTIAGFPLVPIGVGDGYAWTLTSGGSDNSDIYVETLDGVGHYLFQGGWRDLECRVESIPVAGEPAPRQETLCDTVHGPIVAAAGNTALSFKNATFGHELESLEAWQSLARAHNIHDFASQLDRVAYNFNVLYADRTGNIAYWHIGFIPVRADGDNPFFLHDGTGSDEWQGILPFDQNPHALNPPRGWMASWNNKPAPGWENSSADFWLWGGAHRVNTLMHLLDDLGPRSATPETLEDINHTAGWTTDTPTGNADAVFVSSDLSRMLAAVDVSADPRLPGVVERLGSWDLLQVDADSDGYYDGPEGTIFNAWWTELAGSVFDELDGISNRFVIGNLVDRMLRGDNAGLPLNYDYLQGESVQSAVTEALIGALDQLQASFGTPSVDAWHQPIATIDWTPLPATVGVGSTIWMNRGTYNQIVDLRGNVWAENVIAPGQSEDPTSPHWNDQLPLYTGWTYKPMRLSKSDLRDHIESEQHLTLP
ncbi:MAG: penicillin acylase family protein [Acidimicrobiia bacterium]